MTQENAKSVLDPGVPWSGWHLFPGALVKLYDLELLALIAWIMEIETNARFPGRPGTGEHLIEHLYRELRTLRIHGIKGATPMVNPSSPKPNTASNLIYEAAGSLREARRLILQYLQETRLTAENAEQCKRLLEIRDGLERVQVSLEMGARVNRG